jgi:hypothetical protein
LTLRVAATIASPVVPAWQWALLEELHAARDVELQVVVTDAAPPPRGGALWRRYEAWDRGRRGGPDDPLRPCDASDLFAGAHSGPPDVLVHLAGGDPPATDARHGVWTLHDGDGTPLASPAALIAAVRSRPPVATAALHAGGTVLREAHRRVDPHSLQRTRHAVLWSAAALVVRQLRDPGASGRTAPRAAAAAPPGSASTLAFLARLAGRLAWRRAESRIVDERWFVAYRPRPGRADGFRRLPAPPGTQLADPFAFERDGRHHVFVELLPPGSDRGVIAVSELDPAGGCTAPHVVLERPYHLAYPCVFEEDGEVFMVPDTAANRTVELYRAEAFPDRWALDAVLLSDVDAVDATIVRRDGAHWMFVTERAPGGGTHEELSVYMAEALRGPWTPHPLNPVVSDVRCARPAGRPFADGAELMRPAQDCARRYGRAVAFRRVERLTPTEYREADAGRIEPDWWPRLRATHTYGRDSRFEVVDGREWRLRLRRR